MCVRVCMCVCMDACECVCIICGYRCIILKGLLLTIGAIIAVGIEVNLSRSIE